MDDVPLLCFLTPPSSPPSSLTYPILPGYPLHLPRQWPVPPTSQPLKTAVCLKDRESHRDTLGLPFLPFAPISSLVSFWCSELFSPPEMIGFSLSQFISCSPNLPSFPPAARPSRAGASARLRPLGEAPPHPGLGCHWLRSPVKTVSTLYEVFKVIEPPELELELCASAVCTYCLAFLFLFFFFHRMDPAPRTQSQKLESDRPPICAL